MSASTQVGEIDRPIDNRDGVAADPDVVAVAEPCAIADPGVVSGRLVATGTLDFRLSTSGWVGVWHATWHGTDYRWGTSGAAYDKAFDSLFAGLARIASRHGRPN
jgi:hypothetical protein